MGETRKSRLSPRPPLVERDAFADRNEVLFLMLGLISIAERILSVVPELIESPEPEAAPAAPKSDRTASVLR